jgi:hypothetical protein
MFQFESITCINLPEHNWQHILEHCKRKLDGNFLEGESRVRRAYGLVAGRLNKDILDVRRILPIKKNVRDREPFKGFMDRIMAQYAIPSKTPMSNRGWVTDPEELKEQCDRCDQEGLMVFGTYHMHVVPWENDPLRETPTRLDSILAQNSNLFSFIVSMVDVTRPVMRAFYEGVREKEVPVLIREAQLTESD